MSCETAMFAKNKEKRTQIITFGKVDFILNKF